MRSFLSTLILAAAVVSGSPPCAVALPGGDLTSGPERRSYDLDFSLEVEGRMRVVVSSYFYRFQKTALALDAVPEGQGYRFIARELTSSPAGPAYGIGEGPFKLQRYILLSGGADGEGAVPYQEAVARLVARSEAERLNRGTLRRSRAKEEHVNLYRAGAPMESFAFHVTPSGAVRELVNGMTVETLRVTGGDHAAPHFFDLLAASLLCVPSSSPREPLSPAPAASWTVSCEPVIESLAALVEQVYGMPIRLDEVLSGEGDIGYEAVPEPGTDRARITGSLLTKRPFAMSVRGLDGTIWLEEFHRRLRTDLSTGRVLEDEIRLAFGLERQGLVFSLEGVTSRILYHLREAVPPAAPTPAPAGSGLGAPSAR